MDQTTATISKIFNGENRSYTRFSLAQDADGDSTQVELKNSSSDGDEEAGETLGGRVSRDTYGPQPWHSPKTVALWVAGILFIFIVGVLLGYASIHKPTKECLGQAPADEDGDLPQLSPQPGLTPDKIPDWADVRMLLESKLSADYFTQCFEDFQSGDHEAGSLGDMELGVKVIGHFTNLKMTPWMDKHYIKISRPLSASPNKVSFGTEEVGRPQGYLAYSARGIKQGRIVYGNYGELADLGYLLINNISLNGSVVLVRAGRISFAEKVANAEKHGAVAVLIYTNNMNCGGSCELFGHVHLGSGDPYTPGFPSFNHTQFPPIPSSGLPGILAQTITLDMASKLFGNMHGPAAPPEWNGVVQFPKLGAATDLVTVEVNNALADTEVANVFGVIKGFLEPDRYVVLGAQRDSWGYGYAKSTVGTCLLVELARAIRDMVDNGGFRPRRSIVFASWSAGEYGNVGATEWLEGYLSSLNMKAFTYISLDGVITGSKSLKASASPMLYKLILETLKEVKSPVLTGTSSRKTLYDDFAQTDWESSVMRPMTMDNPAYPFLAFSGIPSVSFRFGPAVDDYPYFGTLMDTKDRLESTIDYRTAAFAVAAAQVAGNMALRLVHDHLLRLDVNRYKAILRSQARQIVRQSRLGTSLNTQWLSSAVGSFGRATDALMNNILNSDLSDIEMCHALNDRIMRVEGNLLSPYVSPRDAPFRHIVFGSGSHTLQVLLETVNTLKQNSPESDLNVLRTQLALTTWTIQGSANTLAGNVWEMDNRV